MYDIYIKNFLDASGTEVTTETLLYSIPITDFTNVLIDPVVKCELGKAGTFEFTVQPDHPYYNCWQQMKTIMRVVYGGSTIFRGRALTIDNTMYRTKKLHFEGDMAFLLDTLQPPTKEEKRQNITILAYLTQIINNHNAQVQEANQADKVFTLGEVPGQYSNAIIGSQKVNPEPTKKYGNDSWETSMSSLEALQKDFGGYFRTRYDNGTIYIDWLDNWYSSDVNGQAIEVTKNLIDVQNSAEVDNIFTVLIPVGAKKSEPLYIEDYNGSYHGESGNNKNKRILVPDIVQWFIDQNRADYLSRGYHSVSDYTNAINKYGIIYKTQKFDAADTQEKLWKYACEYIADNYFGGLTSFNIGALDMHHINGVVQKYLCGDQVTVEYADVETDVDENNDQYNETVYVTKTLTISTINYNLHNPEKNQYTIGIPNSLLNKKYGNAVSSKGGGGGASSLNNKTLAEQLAESDTDLSELSVLAWQIVINTKFNSDEFNIMYATDPPEAASVLKAVKLNIQKFLGSNNPLSAANRYVSDVIIGDGKIDMKPQYPSGAPINQTIRDRLSMLSSMVFDAYNGSIDMKQKYNATQHANQNPLTVAKLVSQGGNGGTDGFRMLANSFTQNDDNNNPLKSLGIDGNNGVLSTIIGAFGLNGEDGEGALPSVIVDGVNAVQKYIDPDTLEDFTGDITDAITDLVPSVEIFGGNGGGGSPGGINVGLDSNDNWQIKLNDTITYEYPTGTTNTVTGFVSAKDFHVDDIPSFKTKLAVIDNLVANKASINDLTAAVARITTLETDYLKTTDLASKIANISVINAQRIDLGTLSASYAIYLESKRASWKSKQVVTGLTLSTSATYEDTGYNQHTGQLVNGITKEWVYYLGRDSA